APQGWTPPPARPGASASATTGEVPHPATAPRGFSPQTSFTPEPSTGRAFDDDATSMLAQRADIAQQALAELSQLSAYRPKAVPAEGGSALVRRTPGTIPAAPAIETSKSGPRADRDANQVRSLLSSFQSGTSRGRQAADETTPQSSDGGTRSVGGDDGSADGHGNPVTVPGADLTQRSTSW
ncbi:hypothetical protein, partial [Actinotalea sp. C106]|uniref:hypothetical protein n=1 Tax=Actinotalea sp. C106 TaxID=2908644 RepID=UPI0020286DAE